MNFNQIHPPDYFKSNEMNHPNKYNFIEPKKSTSAFTPITFSFPNQTSLMLPLFNQFNININNNISSYPQTNPKNLFIKNEEDDEKIFFDNKPKPSIFNNQNFITNSSNEIFVNNLIKNETNTENNSINKKSMTINKEEKSEEIHFYQPKLKSFSVKKINNNDNIINNNYNDYNYNLYNGNNQELLNKIFENIKKEKTNEKKIFDIQNVSKGRISTSSSRKGSHNRLSKDNIKRKVKGHFINSIYNYLINQFNRNKNKKEGSKNFKLLKKISPSQKNQISKSKNKDWLQCKIMDVFSVTISKKLKNYEEDFNQKKIEEIIRTNKEKKVIEILKKTVKEMLEIYLSKVDDGGYRGFERLEDVVDKLEEKGENEEYIKKYVTIANEFLLEEEKKEEK